MLSSNIEVLIVDDEPAVRRMLSTMLSQAGIPNHSAGSGPAALQLLAKAPFSAIISDLQMPGMSGLQLLAAIHRQYPHIAFLMATGTDDVRIGVEAMKQGADDYLVKPFQVDVVLASLDRAVRNKLLQQELENYRYRLEEMVAERTAQLQTAMCDLKSSYAATLETLGTAIDLRDSPTAGHSRRVFWYSVKIAHAMGGLQNELNKLAMGAWLHDIGKLAIPDSVLLKPGALTDQERRIMQQHVQIGYDLVKGIPFLADAAELILRHHERCDGSGYPHGLAGCDIPVPAKIFAVADSFDAMTSDRPYRSALPVSVARKEISEKSATLFDAHVVAAFLTIPADAWPSIREQAGTIAIASVLSPSSLNSFLELGCETQHPIEPQPDGGRSCHSEPHREETACPQNRA